MPCSKHTFLLVCGFDRAMMATFGSVYRYRFIVLLWGIVECLLFTGVVYGWASLVFALKEDSFFKDFCPGSPLVENITSSNDHCTAQDDLLNLAFTIGVFTFTAFGVVAGALLDNFGPRITRFTACLVFVITWIIFGFTDKDRPMLIFPGVIGLAVSGILLFVSLLQIPVMFKRWRSLVSSLFNGALDSSSIVLLFFKLLHDAGISLKWIFCGYFIIAVTSIIIFTFVLPAAPMRFEQVENISEKNVSVSGTLIETHSDSDGDDLLQEIFKKTDPERHEKKIKQGAFREFWEIVKSPMYMLLVLYLSVHKLRLWFFMGNMDIFLRFASDDDIDSVNAYLNSFGVIQFMGVLFAPIVGVIMDWRPTRRDNKSFGFIVAISVTNSLNVILNIIVVIPALEIQLFSFVVQVILRAFLYCTYAAFILHRFPHEHCGKLYGTGHCIGAIVGAIQFYLFVIVQTRLKGDPFWVNVGFLVFTFMLYVFPLYIWVVTERETQAAAVLKQKDELKSK